MRLTARTTGWLLAALALAAGAAPRSGGASTYLPTSSEVLPDEHVDGFLVLVEARSEEAIRRDILDAGVAAEAAAEALAEARDQDARTRARIDLKKADIARIKAQVKVAETEDAAAEKKDLETRKKAEERNLKLLERKRDLRQAELDWAEAARDAAAAERRAGEAELELAQRREAHRLLLETTGDEALKRLARAEDDLRAAEKHALERFRDRAAKIARTTERSKTLFEKRLKVLDAQREVRKRN